MAAARLAIPARRRARQPNTQYFSSDAQLRPDPCTWGAAPPTWFLRIPPASTAHLSFLGSSAMLYTFSMLKHGGEALKPSDVISKCGFYLASSLM